MRLTDAAEQDGDDSCKHRPISATPRLSRAPETVRKFYTAVFTDFAARVTRGHVEWGVTSLTKLHPPMNLLTYTPC